MKIAALASVPLIAFLVCTALPAHAEMGPCKPDEKRDVMIFGGGNGAAIVIRDTPSPSKRLALAWRTPDAPPTKEPDDDKIELLVLRLADGAILSRSKTAYWDTGEMHVNRLEELASWSPSSRLLIRTFNSRFSTDNVEIYAFGADDAVTGPLDLLKIIGPAVRARLKLRGKNPDDFDFSLTEPPNYDEKPLSIDDRGRIRADVMMWVPKKGPSYYYAVKARVARVKELLVARILSIEFLGMLKD
jgi:hypothetical protein